jgi:methyl-accepting chemotaxis protein/cytochrome b561
MSYSKPLRWIHWTIAILVVCQLAIAVVLTQLRSLAYGQMVLALHRQLGLVIFALIAVRLIAWRRGSRPPPDLSLPRWQVKAASIVHVAFFAILLVQPLLGILVAWGRGDEVAVLGIARFSAPFEISDALRERLMTAHEAVAALLLTLCVMHVGAVIFNRNVRRVAVLDRMLPLMHKELLVNRVSVVTQLSLAFGLLIAIAVGMGTTAVVSYRSLSRAAQEFQDSNVAAADAVRNAQAALKDFKSWSLAQGSEADTAHGKELLEATKSSLDDALAHSPANDAKGLIASLDRKVGALTAANTLPAGAKIDNLDGALQDTVDAITISALQARSDSDERAARGHDLIVVAMLPMLLIGLCVALTLSRSITSQLSRMRDLIRSIEHGRHDTALKVEGQGEFARLVRDIESMRGAIEGRANQAAARQARLEAEQAKAARELLHREAEMQREQSEARRVQREQLAAEFELQVADIVATVVNMARELSASAMSMASSASNATQRSRDASQGAERTSGTASEIASGSGELSGIARSVRENAEESKARAGSAVEEAGAVKAQIDRLVAAVNEISSTTDMIAGVARQTNLLAINARIEAARAGDVGRGFSVVADEVKVLANQTREATQGIETHISQIKAAAALSAEALARLGQVIAGVDQAASAIFAETDAQFASTRQMVARITEISTATRSVLDDTREAQETAGETERLSTAVVGTVTVIDEQASQLREKIASFLNELRGGAVASAKPVDRSRADPSRGVSSVQRLAS